MKTTYSSFSVELWSSLIFFFFFSPTFQSGEQSHLTAVIDAVLCLVVCRDAITRPACVAGVYNYYVMGQPFSVLHL